MKKNLLLRLCLILMVALTISSCRTDHFPEAQNFNDSSKFKLTSKRISLHDAKHKTLLLPELEKSKGNLKKFSQKISGKTVSYADGVTIDTDNVTYIENGPNYHTYTFYIKRENAPADAPLENLVLSPMADGTYKELLIAYNLSPLEKEQLQNGLPIDLKNKTTITTLDSGTYSPGLLSKEMVCHTELHETYTTCSANEHHHGEEAYSEDNPNGCKATILSVKVIVAIEVCNYSGGGSSGEPGSPPGTGGAGGGDGSGEGGTHPNENPCNENGVLTGPQQPGIADPNGCNAGIPSIPTSPTRITPCKKLKNITNNTNGLKSKIDSLNKKDILELNYEKGATVSEDAQGNTTLTSQDGNPGNTFITVNIPTTGEVMVYVHTHFEASDMLPVFTIEDLITFDAIHFQRRANNKSLDKVAMMVISKAGVFAMVIEDSNLFYTMGGKLLTNDRANLEEKYYGDLRKKVSVTNDDVIKQISKSLPNYGISMYKANADLSNWNKMSYNPATDIVDEIPCN